MLSRLAAAVSAALVLSGLVAAAPATSSSGSAAADGSTGQDWFVLEVEVASPTGAPADLAVLWELGGTLSPAGDDERWIATGQALADVDGFLRPERVTPGATTASVVTPLGSHELSLEPAPADGAVTFDLGFAADANAVRAHWLFTFLATGQDVVDVRVGAPQVVKGKLVRTQLHRGSGARAHRAFQPSTWGVGAHVGALGGGLSVDDLSMGEGIHGVFAQARCRACLASWASPDGRGRSNLHVDAVVMEQDNGHHAFAGPAGQWRFTWTGYFGEDELDPYAGDGVALLWAPVGDLWRHLDLAPGT